MESTSQVAAIDGSLIAVFHDFGLHSVVINGGQPLRIGDGLTTLTRGTMLSPTLCLMPKSQPTSEKIDVGGLAFTREFSCSVPQHGNVSVQVTDRYLPSAHSVSVSTAITAAELSPYFSAGMRTGLSWPISGADRMQLWLPWAKGCVQNNGKGPGMCFTAGPWREALSAEYVPRQPEHFRFGGMGNGARDSFTLPIATLLFDVESDSDAGLSLALDPSDSLTELTLHTSPSAIGFERELLRMGGGKGVGDAGGGVVTGKGSLGAGAPNPPPAVIVQFTAHLVGHARCYRPGLAFLVSAFPSYFVPPAGDARSSEFEGLASYSWNQAPIDAVRARALGFKTNWDLSGTFMPYDGLFLPYQDRWLNLGPINRGLAQYNATYAKIEALYESYQREGFHSLSYFDIGNWGTRTNTRYKGPVQYCGTRPNGKPAPCPDPNGANAYLRDQLWPALLHHGWSVNGGKFMVHHYDWVGTTDMDTMEPIFEDLIVEQAQRHVDRLKKFEGIAIDRLDYSEFFNYDRDDGVSFVPVNGTKGANYSTWSWGVARALRLSYRHTFGRLHGVLHNASRSDSGGKTATRGVMFNNCNWLCRLDMNKNFDGTFSEGAALNAVAWTGLRQPTILWTYSLGEVQAELDAYFQQHILMNTYPMAPMPKNDHSITPGTPAVEKAYQDYARLFDAMHGARWLLTAQPVRLEGSNTTTTTDPSSIAATTQTLPPSFASVNVFVAAKARASVDRTHMDMRPKRSSESEPTSPPLPNLLVPIMLANASAGLDDAVTLVLSLGPTVKSPLNWPIVSGVTLNALYPGMSAEKSLGEAVSVGSGVWKARVPLVRGFSFVRAELRVRT